MRLINPKTIGRFTIEQVGRGEGRIVKDENNVTVFASSNHSSEPHTKQCKAWIRKQPK